MRNGKERGRERGKDRRRQRDWEGRELMNREVRTKERSEGQGLEIKCKGDRQMK